VNDLPVLAYKKVGKKKTLINFSHKLAQLGDFLELLVLGNWDFILREFFFLLYWEKWGGRRRLDLP
jgi:hypothetical protein